jgi:hypothetical protein
MLRVYNKHVNPAIVDSVDSLPHVYLWDLYFVLDYNENSVLQSFI